MPRQRFAILPGLMALLLLFSTGCSLISRLSQGNTGQPTPIPAVSTTQSVRVDGARRFQTIDGFGANINGVYWGDGKLAPALDMLYNEMGATIFRVIIETTEWELVNDNADPQAFNWASYRGIYADPQFQSLWAIVRYLEQKPDAKVLLNVMGPMPGWMGDGRIDKSAEDEWVEMIASLVVYAQDEQGLQLRLLAPLNEIDLGPPEGPRMDGDQYARLMHKLVVRLQALGRDNVSLVVPDIAYNTKASQYLGPLLEDSTVMAQVASFSIHDYSGTISDVGAVIASSAYPDRSFWLTEYSQWCRECNKSPQQANEWLFGADTAEFLLSYLQHGASAGLLYDGVDGFYQHHGTFDYWGVLAYDPQTGAVAPRPRFHASAQLFRFIRPGMVRLDVVGVEPGLPILAFVDPASGALSIVGRNPTANPVRLQISLDGLEHAELLSLTQTTAAANLVPGGEFSPDNGVYTVDVAADSIFALSSLRP